ncbi:helix-turn-helix domain-containing protein [Puniceicoccales bacterium CK1056]|uniref:Helix-turn-helix domain-containing protein n=1 Tax=Oceanipulchritudo coccoides TaxID=2706888 RepID=A0A6B2M272_9BACT|nr:helix-turn-helix domain-containing protein [Oceanipulchritudo coccoides]NDV63101.1 helix-turn-helix domain-containing protein [Oceanipulchritudo coccoides]
MSKGFSSFTPESSASEDLKPMLNGTFNPGFFHYLQNLYRAKTGYNLVLSDVNGSIQMGLPDCDKFPCMRTCRECRERIVSEALRTGKVCVDACHEGYILWGLPFSVDGVIRGGLIVIGGEQDLHQENNRFKAACRELYRLMHEHQLLSDSHDIHESNFQDVHRFVFRNQFNELSEKLGEYGTPFIRCLKNAEFEEAEKHFEKIRDAFRNNADLPLDLIRGLVGDLVFQARQQFIGAGMDAYACSSEAGTLIESISKARTSQQIEAILEGFLKRFVLLSKQKSKDPDDHLIEKATTYLEKHIRDELTRESVAKAVGISPSHFSRLIREKKGRTFTDLLNQYRIERACSLLVRSSHSLAQIASETGFCDQSYFSKVFRRYKDVTPAKYRETHIL